MNSFDFGREIGIEGTPIDQVRQMIVTRLSSNCGLFENATQCLSQGFGPEFDQLPTVDQ